MDIAKLPILPLHYVPADGELAARGGIWWQARSAVSATGTVAGTFKESLWKSLFP